MLFSSSLTQSVHAAENWPRMLGPSDDAAIPAEAIRTDWTGGLPIAWNITVGEGYGNAVVSQGRMYHFDRYGNNERLTCYSLNDAKVLWQLDEPVEYRDSFGYNNGPRAMPVANEDYVVAYGVKGNLIVADAKTGQKLWSKDCNAAYSVPANFFGVGSTPLIYKDRLIVMVGGSDASQPSNRGLGSLNQQSGSGSGIVAFDLATGKQLYQTGDYLASYSAPTIHKINGRDWCLAFMREGLLILDPESGEEVAFFRWRAAINESVNAAWPVVSGEQVFISETYELGSILLKFRDGQLSPIWQDPSNRKNQSMRAHWSTPILIDGILYGGSGRNEPDSDLRAVRWSDGELLWVERTHARANTIAIGKQIIVVDEFGLLQLIQPDPQRLIVQAQMDLQTLNDRDYQKPAIGSPIWAPPTYAEKLLIIRGGEKMIALELGKQ